jgi:hypothetical protein
MIKTIKPCQKAKNHLVSVKSLLCCLFEQVDPCEAIASLFIDCVVKHGYFFLRAVDLDTFFSKLNQACAGLPCTGIRCGPCNVG